jgi:acyl-CoA synthetase (AMP-forming)/AMP-acid ligase II
VSGRLGTQPTVGGLLSTFADHAERMAVVFGDRRATYQQLDERSRQLATGLLDLVAARPARIGLLFPNDDRFVTTFLGITRVGSVAVPISTFSTAQELRQLIVRARLHAVILTDRNLNHDYLGALDDGWSERDRPAVVCWPEGAEMPAGWTADTDWSKVEALERALDPGDAAFVVHTSGSTSRPKAVLHNHRGLMRSAERGAHERGFDDHSCVWTPMPFFWVGGLYTVMLAALSVGGRVVGSPSNEPSTILDLLEREQATHVMAWPHSAKALGDDPTYPDRDLRRLEPRVLTPPVSKGGRTTVPVTLLGMTETAGPYTTWPPAVVDIDMAGSHGVPAPGMEVKIVDIETRRELAPGAIGAIIVRGDTLAIAVDDGTPRAPIGSDGWLDTGDLGSFRNGHLFFHGRTDDRIKAKGTNVTPVEVEAALRSIDGVATAYVTGVDLEGTEVVGAVISRATGRSLSEVEVRAACRRLLSSYKVPTIIALIDSKDLPMLSTGKPDLRALRSLLEERSTRS